MKSMNDQMKKLYILLIGLTLSASCEKNKDLPDHDLYPVNLENPDKNLIDINSDQIIDFAIEYMEYSTDDVPSSAGSIIGSLKPLNQNQLLFRPNDGYLFLDHHDTIRKVAGQGLNWFGFGADLISINRHYETWDSIWSILSDKTSNYILAFKLIIDGSENIGWLKLEFDTLNGDIFITDGVYTSNDELVIQMNTTD
jgi:hypothetical protein